VRELRIACGVIEIDGRELRCVPGTWSVATFAGDAATGREWYGDQVAVAGGWHDDVFVAELRILSDAPTFRLELQSSGRLRITRDVGFDGSEVWEGAPATQSATAAHHSAVSP
jgi:hypothetical protein